MSPTIDKMATAARLSAEMAKPLDGHPNDEVALAVALLVSFLVEQRGLNRETFTKLVDEVIAIG